MLNILTNNQLVELELEEGRILVLDNTGCCYFNTGEVLSVTGMDGSHCLDVKDVKSGSRVSIYSDDSDFNSSKFMILPENTDNKHTLTSIKKIAKSLRAKLEEQRKTEEKLLAERAELLVEAVTAGITLDIDDSDKITMTYQPPRVQL